LVAATKKATTIYTNTSLSDPIAFIMGSEETEIDNCFLAIADEAEKIPILGKIESLNVSVAAGLLIYKVIRQRNLGKLCFMISGH
jgi:23S rRNA (guanosine2251-2'-O)-methyltransferase